MIKSMPIMKYEQGRTARKKAVAKSNEKKDIKVILLRGKKAIKARKWTQIEGGKESSINSVKKHR